MKMPLLPKARPQQLKSQWFISIARLHGYQVLAGEQLQVIDRDSTFNVFDHNCEHPPQSFLTAGEPSGCVLPLYLAASSYP